MDKLRANRFAVLSPNLVVPRLEDMERGFIDAWIRMKGNIALESSPPKLSFKQEKLAQNLAADAHSRRMRQAGLTALVIHHLSKILVYLLNL